MGKYRETTTGRTSDGDRVSVSAKSSDSDNTRGYHGYDNGPHTSVHSDGSSWHTGSDGKAAPARSEGGGLLSWLFGGGSGGNSDKSGGSDHEDYKFGGD
jgi:hypothetical protein